MCKKSYNKPPHHALLFSGDSSPSQVLRKLTDDPKTAPELFNLGLVRTSELSRCKTANLELLCTV